MTFCLVCYSCLVFLFCCHLAGDPKIHLHLTEYRLDNIGFTLSVALQPSLSPCRDTIFLLFYSLSVQNPRHSLSVQNPSLSERRTKLQLLGLIDYRLSTIKLIVRCFDNQFISLSMFWGGQDILGCHFRVWKKQIFPSFQTFYQPNNQLINQEKNHWFQTQTKSPASV